MGYSSFTLLAGTVMALYSTHLIEKWLVALIIVCALFCIPLCRQTRKYLIQFILVLIGILIGSHFVSSFAEHHRHLPERVWVSAYLTVEQVDYHSAERSRFVARVTHLRHSNQQLVAQCHCRVQLFWYDAAQRRELAPGQQYQAEIKLKTPTTYWNQGGARPSNFLWAKQLIKQGQVRNMRLIKTTPSVRWRVYRALQASDLDFKGILLALAIGYRGDIPFEQRDVWQKNGLQHVMAISGLHIGLVAGLVFLIVRRFMAGIPQRGILLRNRERLVLTPTVAVVALFVAFLYTGLAGFAISSQRAWLMLLLFWGQRWLGLSTSNWKRLGYAAVILILVDPGSWYDIGFWFSVAAVAVILLCQWAWQLGSNANRWQRVLQTIYLQLLFLTLMGPLSLALFDGVSLIAPISNLLVVPVIALWVLPLTLMGAVAAMMWADVFATQLWWLAELPLIGLQPVLNTFAEIAWTWLTASSLGVISAVLWLCALALLTPMWLMRYYRWILAGVLAMQASYALWKGWRTPDVIVHVLDVGQAQAIVIERERAAWLVDLGRRFYIGRSQFESVIEPFIAQRGLRVERVSLTHRDADHSGDWRLAKQRLPKAEWFGALTEQPCRAGQQGGWREIRWRVLWPDQADMHTSNAASCVYQFSYGEIDWLVTGDIGFPEERILAEQRRLKEVEILVAPHHGSAFSLGSLLLQATQPEVTLVSVGAINHYGMPDKYTRQRALEYGSEWATTADYGQLSIETDGASWRLKTPALFDKTNAKSYSSTSQR